MFDYVRNWNWIQRDDNFVVTWSNYEQLSGVPEERRKIVTSTVRRWKRIRPEASPTSRAGSFRQANRFRDGTVCNPADPCRSSHQAGTSAPLQFTWQLHQLTLISYLIKFCQLIELLQVNRRTGALGAPPVQLPAEGTETLQRPAVESHSVSS